MKIGGRADYVVLPPSANPMDDLVAAAKAEGQLTVVGLQRDWCGYGDIIDSFKAKYGLAVNEVRPKVASSAVIDTIRNMRNGAGSPDVMDIGPSTASAARKEGLLQPYKVSKWAAIPDSARDADGYWHGNYYGTISFEVNADTIRNIPTDWADLVAPEYRNAICLSGRIESNQVIQSVVAAGLSAGGRNVEDVADRGLRFFAKLNRVGNLIPETADSSTRINGLAPIVIRWDYLAAANRERLRNKARIEVVRPRTGVIAGIYAQAISAFAQHPNAARLWMEHLYSDEIQLARLRAHSYPIRLAELVQADQVPHDLKGRLAQFRDYGNGVQPTFPGLEEQERARKIITDGWDSIVGVRLRCQPDDVPSDIPMSGNTAPGQYS